MKSLEKKLKKIGFTNFVYLDKNKRDNLSRFTWSGEYKNEILTILIVQNNKGEWLIEKIVLDHKDLVLETFWKENNISELLNFIENMSNSSDIST